MFGKECILDLYGCSGITDDMLRQYVYDLCDLIGMERYGECKIIWFGKPPFEGYSLLQFITTSSVTGHFTEKKAYINIFSCKDYDESIVKKFTKKWFNAEKLKTRILIRE